MLCRSPARMAGEVLLQVSNNKIDFTEDKVTFVYMSSNDNFVHCAEVVLLVAGLKLFCVAVTSCSLVH